MNPEQAYSKAIRLAEMIKPPVPEEQHKAARALTLTCLVRFRVQGLGAFTLKLLTEIVPCSIFFCAHARVPGANPNSDTKRLLNYSFLAMKFTTRILQKNMLCCRLHCQHVLN